jgi:hypothetical protein
MPFALTFGTLKHSLLSSGIGQDRRTSPVPARLRDDYADIAIKHRVSTSPRPGRQLQLPN